jgi:dienelactone hydrolase
MLLLYAVLAHATDELRWLESHDAPEVVAWRDERTAETLAWLGPDLVTRFSDEIHHRRKDASRRHFVDDYRGGTTLWFRSWLVPFTDEELEAREDGDRRIGTWHGQLTAQLEGVDAPGEPLVAEGVTSEWRVCDRDLSPDGQGVVWSVTPPPEDPRDPPDHRDCHVFFTDLQSGEQRSLGVWEDYIGGIAHDGHTLLFSAWEGAQSVVYAHDLRTDARTELHRSARRLFPSWPHPDVRALWEGATKSAKRTSTYRVHWGEWPNPLAMPARGYMWAGWTGERLLLRLRDGKVSRVVEVDPERPGRRHWHELWRDTDTEKIRSFSRHGDHHLMGLWIDGSVHFFEQPVAGGERVEVFDQHFTGIAARQTLQPTALVRGQTASATHAWLRDLDGTYTEIEGVYGHHETRSERMLVTSQDGTEVPISVIRPEEHEGPSPVWMRCYGGFGSSSKSRFGITEELFVEMGGIIVTVHARGGDERGDAWHEQARREHMGRTYDDVIAAAEWLVREGWTEPGRIALSGTSNGGLTATATMALRPELFGAVITTAGVLDLVRGPAMGNWWPYEYGRLTDGDQAKLLRELSPVHSRPEPLPPVLIATGKDDPTVTPSHSYKLAAAWSDLEGGPALLRVYDWPTHAHHYGKKRAARERDAMPEDAGRRTQAEVLAFLHQALSLPDPAWHDGGT